MSTMHNTVNEAARNEFYSRSKIVQLRSKSVAEKWTPMQCEIVLDMQRKIVAAYSPQEVKVTYHEKHVTLKAVKPNPCVTQNSAIAKLVQYCAVSKIEMTENVNDIIFRMFVKK